MVELVQIHFTLRLRDQHRCKVYMDSYMALDGSCFDGHLNYFQKPTLGGRSNTKLGDHGTLNAHNRWFILSYHVWGPSWIDIHWNSGWGPSHIRLQTTLEDPWPHYVNLEVSWTAFEHFLLGSRNFMVTTLGPCVEWPFMPPLHLTLAKPKSWFLKHNLHTINIM